MSVLVSILEEHRSVVICNNRRNFVKPVHTCNVSSAIVIVRELRQSVNQYDVNRTQVSLSGGFSEFIEIFKMARHE